MFCAFDDMASKRASMRLLTASYIASQATWLAKKAPGSDGHKRHRVKTARPADLLIIELPANRGLEPLPDPFACYRLQVSGSEDAINDTRVFGLFLSGHFDESAWIRGSWILRVAHTWGRHDAIVAKWPLYLGTG